MAKSKALHTLTKYRRYLERSKELELIEINAPIQSLHEQIKNIKDTLVPDRHFSVQDFDSDFLLTKLNYLHKQTGDMRVKESQREHLIERRVTILDEHKKLHINRKTVEEVLNTHEKNERTIKQKKEAETLDEIGTVCWNQYSSK